MISTPSGFKAATRTHEYTKEQGCAGSDGGADYTSVAYETKKSSRKYTEKWLFS